MFGDSLQFLRCRRQLCGRALNVMQRFAQSGLHGSNRDLHLGDFVPSTAVDGAGEVTSSDQRSCLFQFTQWPNDAAHQNQSEESATNQQGQQ
jgi:hypothetical protein